MTTRIAILSCLLSCVLTTAADVSLVDFATLDMSKQLKEQDSKAVVVEKEGRHVLEVELGSSSRWPSVFILPSDGTWDLSAFKGVEVDLRNDSTSSAALAVRVDNEGADGNKNCNTENFTVPPETACTIAVTFGRSWGNAGAQIDPSQVTALLIFSGKNSAPVTLTVTAIRGFAGEARKSKLGASDRHKPVPIEGYPVTVDFEPGVVRFDLEGGALTRQAAETINGTCSLVGDSRGKNRTWFEFFTTRPGLFEPGYEYTVSLRYRVLECAEGTKFYGLLRSLSQGWGQWDRGWTNMAELKADPAKVYEGILKTGISTFGDYELMLGINGDARIIIDDIRIEQGNAYKEFDRETEAIAAIPPAAVVVKTYEFEDPLEAGTASAKYVVTTDPINGAHSLLLDSMESTGSWNIRLSVPLEAGATDGRFHVYLKSKALAWAKGQNNAYIVVKHVDGKDSGDLVWKRWRGPIGVTRDTYLTFDLPKGGKASLDLAIFKQGKMLADDLVIRREPLPEQPIATRKPLVCNDENLVWREEFDGDALDTSRWNVSHEPRTGGWWSTNNVSLQNGSLALRFSKEPDHFAMGSVNTQDKFSFTYGYVEARMKLPAQVGHWPGIWLISKSVTAVGNGGRDGVEVDIVECPWRDKDRASHALHWDGYSLDHQSRGKHVDVPGLNEGWHTYAVDWSPAGYIFFIDGKETWRTDVGGACDVPLYIILSDEKGGWSGDPNQAKQLPDHTYIDYVRVWQKADYTGTGE